MVTLYSASTAVAKISITGRIAGQEWESGINSFSDSAAQNTILECWREHISLLQWLLQKVLLFCENYAKYDVFHFEHVGIVSV